MRLSMAPKKGRPKGSRTREYVVVRERPPKCPSCGSTNRKVVEGRAPEIMDYATAEYDRIVRRLMVCECGQHLKVAFEESESKNKNLI